MISTDLSPAALESTIASDLRDALRARGLDVSHNGTTTQTATGGQPDIDVTNDDVHMNVEATKLRYVAQANAEATSVTAHLEDRAAQYPEKTAFAVFVSPATAERTREHFHLYNAAHAAEDRWVVTIEFDTLNLLTEYLLSPEGQGKTVRELVDVLRDASALDTDDAVLELLNERLFEKAEIAEEIARIRRDRLLQKYSKLDAIFKRIHDGLRTVVGLGPTEAFHELSKLIFLKMYEEQRVERETQAGGLPENYFTTEYIRRQRARHPAPQLHPIIEYFDQIRAEFAGEGLFDAGESIEIERDKVDANYIDVVVAHIEDFQFVDPTVPLDIKGLIYEQFLGLSLKNTDLGQYFTPDPIIDFVVRLAQPKKDERVHDPAAGTGRFLVAAMHTMLEQCEDEDEERTVRQTLLTGVEKSPLVAKIAKMNMFVHGDGRANLLHGDSLDIDRDREPIADVILTNPPLGDINFKNIKGDFAGDPDWYRAMEVVPRKTTRNRQGVERTSVSRNELKGGALFINRFAHLVAPGGRILSVIDEGILNTDEYRDVREFILRNFEVRAVFSLTDDAFKYASKTATKTSVLYLVRKEDPDVAQTRPVFFGHAFKVGINTRGKATRNDLYDPERPLDLLRAYREFEAAYEESVEEGAEFNAIAYRGKLEGIGFEAYSDYSYFGVPFDAINDRLEYKWYDPTFDLAEERLAAMDTVPLSEIVVAQGEYGLTATGLEQGDHEFINIENLRPDGTIDLTGVRYVLNSSVRVIDTDGNEGIKAKVQTREDDLLISRSRLPGIAAVVSESEAGMIYGSYIIRFRLDEDSGFGPRYVALFINSILGQAQIHRLKSGSNGSNINAPQLGALRIARLNRADQERVVEAVTKQHETARRFGSLKRHYEEAGELLLLEACMGVEASVEVDALDAELEPHLAEAERALEGAREASPEVETLRSLGDHFLIRPTFSGRIAGSSGGTEPVAEGGDSSPVT